MLRKFASIAHPETHGYAYDSEAWTSQAPLDTHFRMYQTYGDGLCQHSGDWPVTSEYFADYMVSLAQSMLADSELAERLVYDLNRRPCTKSIAFCASIVFKAAEGSELYERKPRYYSVSEQKISTAPAKQYDKRYQRVESWNDGSAKAIYRMLLPDYANGLERFSYAEAVREWTLSTEGQYMELSGTFLEWTKDPDEARFMYHAFETARNTVESYRLRVSAEQDIESIKRNIERKRKRAAESTEAAA